MESDQSCLELAQQLHAVEQAIANAKKTLIHNHLDRGLDESIRAQGDASRKALEEFKEITTYLG